MKLPEKSIKKLVWGLLIAHAFYISPVRAAELPVPNTTAPAKALLPDALFKPNSTCARLFIYRNRTYPVDSSRKLDGEGLRFVFKKAPATEALLDEYQSKLKTSTIPAFVATFGGLLAVGGWVYGGSIESHLGKRDTRYAFLLSGIFLALAGYSYGQLALHNKEKVLEKAVKTYNDSVPAPERIQVGFTPLPEGKGGEIKTMVPF